MASSLATRVSIPHSLLAFSHLCALPLIVIMLSWKRSSFYCDISRTLDFFGPPRSTNTRHSIPPNPSYPLRLLTYGQEFRATCHPRLIFLVPIRCCNRTLYVDFPSLPPVPPAYLLTPAFQSCQLWCPTTHTFLTISRPSLCPTVVPFRTPRLQMLLPCFHAASGF